MREAKRRKLSDDEAEEGSEPEQLDESSDESQDVESATDTSVIDGDESPDTEDEIAGAQQRTKSKKTLKRKRRAASPSHFGLALQTLLNTDAPTNLPLSLNPSVAKKQHDDKVEVKAKKVVEGERKEREETNHVRDVIGGWGGESERKLRKVAQRGVVKLFNVIQQTQAATAAVTEDAKAHKGSGKPRLAAPVIDSKRKGGRKVIKDSASSAAKEPLAPDDFLDMIRQGGIVSKA